LTGSNIRPINDPGEAKVAQLEDGEVCMVVVGWTKIEISNEN
jgi:hypothetical protein